MVGFEPRHGAKGGVVAFGRDQRDLVADDQAEPPRQPLANRDSVIAEIGERAGHDVVGDQLAGADVVRADAAHHGAGRAAGAGRHDLSLDQRGDVGDAGNFAHRAGHRIEIRQ